MRLSAVLAMLGAGALFVATPRLAHASSSCAFPGFTKAAFGDTGVDVQNGQTDSYNSASGSYATTNCSIAAYAPCAGGVGTNSTTSGGAITINPGGQVKGDCQVGAGGTVADIGGSGGSTLCSSTSAETSTTTMYPVTTPTVTMSSPTNKGGTTCSGADAGTPCKISDTMSPTAGFGFGKVSLTGSSAALTVAAGNYVFYGDFKISGSSGSIIKNSTGTTYVYLDGPAGTSVSIGGNGISNTDGSGNMGKPTDLIFMCTNNVTSASITGNGNASFAFYCPKADITVTGNAVIYGAIVGKSVKFSGTNPVIHYDAALGSLSSSNLTCGGETSRAAPIIASIVPSYGGAAQSALVQGSFEAPMNQLSVTTTAASGTGSVAAWVFPYVKGHLRARLVSSITTTASSITGNVVCTSSGSPSGCNTLFDGSAMIPTASATCTSPSGTCRYVFTNTNSASTDGRTFHPTTQQLLLNDTNTSRVQAIGSLIASTTDVSGIGNTEWKGIINKILQSYAGTSASVLGGVDRSAVAVVGPSNNGAGSSTRVKMVYWGGLDGMLHAACAEKPTSGTCSNVNPGTELWAFIPKVQLPFIRTNTQRIDGSIRVMDVYGDFTNDPATGTKSWKTILLFTSGFGTGVYALDVTTPSSPTLLWEVVKPTTVGATEIGSGLRIVMGPVRIAGKLTNLSVAETRNGGTGGAGVVVKALETETGRTIWTFANLYPTTYTPSTTGLPGGAVGVDVVGTGEYSDFVFGDLYGRLWMVDATTGISRQGATTPLFAFGIDASNYRPISQPPVIYSNGTSQYAVIASGAYVDQTDTSGNGLWVLGTQYIVGVKLDQKATTSSSETTTPSANGAVSFLTSFTGFGFAQAVVVGTQLFVTTDSQDANAATYGQTANTGTLRTYSLGTSSSAPSLSSTTVISSGASSLANTSTTLVSSSGQTQQLMSNALGTTGNKVDLNAYSKIARMLWLRAE